MSQRISLKETERQAFRATFQDGLWDVLLGCFALQFAIAPLLSTRLGDFWSSVVFLPFWLLAYTVIWLLRKYVVKPRLGSATFGRARARRLMRFTLVMLIGNVLALILGVVAALNPTWGGSMPVIVMGVMMLAGLSLGAYFLDYPILYFYGVLLALALPVGEWLWRHKLVTHHGFPLTFGIATATMILIGLYKFVRLLRRCPLPATEEPEGV
jgi:hypothetical protein